VPGHWEGALAANQRRDRGASASKDAALIQLHQKPSDRCR